MVFKDCGGGVGSRQKVSVTPKEKRCTVKRLNIDDQFDTDPLFHLDGRLGVFLRMTSTSVYEVCAGNK